MGHDRAGTRVVMTKVADGAFVLDEATGTLYHLNPTGALAYELLSTGKHTVTEVAEVIASTFAVDRTAALAHVRAFASDLTRHKLVQRWV